MLGTAMRYPRHASKLPLRTGGDHGKDHRVPAGRGVPAQVRDQLLLKLYFDGEAAITEWLAEFDYLVQGIRKWMQETAVLVFEEGLVKSLRDCWASEQIGQLAHKWP